MPIKNGRYKDSRGNVRHFETNENMVVVDSGQKTLKQKLTEILATIQEAVSSKVDALFVKDITGDKTQLQTVDKTNLVNAINELKRTGGGGSGATLNVFKRTGGTWGEFTATTATTTFDVAGFNGIEKCLDVYYKGLPLIPEKDFTVNSTGSVTLGFTLEAGESVDYCMSDVSFDYNELANKPNLDLKADKLYVDGEFTKSLKIVNAVDSDFNNYTTIGIYRITNNNQANKPPFERVQYGILEVIPIPSSNAIKQIAYDLADNKIWHRSKASLNEAWSEWKQVVTTDATTALETKIDGLSQHFYWGFSSVNSSFTQETPIDDIVSNMKDNSRLVAELSKDVGIYPHSNGQLVIERTNAYRVTLYFYAYRVQQRVYRAEWITHVTPKFSGWVELAQTMTTTDIALLNGWTCNSAFPNVIVQKSGNMATITGLIQSGTKTSGTTLFNIPSGYRPTQGVKILQVAYTSNGISDQEFIRISISAGGVVVIDTTFTKPYLAINLTYPTA